MKLISKAVLAAATLAGLLGSQARADDAPAWGTITGAVAVTSDYRFRGISQNDRDPAPQGTINWSGPDGFYVGSWASEINWQLGKNNNPAVEWDIYGGKHFDLGGTDLNIEAYYYAYPDYDNFHITKAASYYETIVQLSHTFGPLTVTATGANSPEFSLGGGVGWYAEGTASYAINDWLTASANVGNQWVDAAPEDYTHYDIGATASYHGFALDARWVDTSLNKFQCAAFWMGTKNACAGGFVATLTYNITALPW